MWLIPGSQKENNTVTTKCVTGWERFGKPFIVSQWLHPFVTECHAFPASCVGTVMACYLVVHIPPNGRFTAHAPNQRGPFRPCSPCLGCGFLTKRSFSEHDALLPSRMWIEQSRGILTFHSVLKLHIDGIRKVKPSRNCWFKWLCSDTCLWRKPGLVQSFIFWWFSNAWSLPPIVQMVLFWVGIAIP